MLPAAAPRPWTNKDEAFLREHYPTRGSRYCADELKRTRGAIKARAQALGISSRGGRGVAIEPSEAIDAAIRAAYRRPAGEGARSRLPERLGVSQAWVIARAIAIGALKPDPARRPWKPRELEILEAHAKASATTVSAALKAAGFRRSPAAVEYARSRFKPVETDARLHTIPEVADLLGLSKTTPHKWICDGMLRLAAGGLGKGAGRMVVTEDDLARFIVEHPHAVDLAKVQIAGSGPWLIDLLARRGTVATLTPAETQADRIVALITARPDLLNDRRQVALMLDLPFESVTVTISQAIKAGRIHPARAAA